MSLRSLIETVACQHLIGRRKYTGTEELSKIYDFSQLLFGKLQAMRRSLQKNSNKKKEPTEDR